jgi:hypothetical protein
MLALKLLYVSLEQLKLNTVEFALSSARGIEVTHPPLKVRVLTPVSNLVLFSVLASESILVKSHESSSLHARVSSAKSIREKLNVMLLPEYAFLDAISMPMHVKFLPVRVLGV